MRLADTEVEGENNTPIHRKYIVRKRRGVRGVNATLRHFVQRNALKKKKKKLYL